jgi:threonine dehydrogenase-like Zn-dependent dehydrogenase
MCGPGDVRVEQREDPKIIHLVATHGQPGPDLIPSLLAASDVLGTGWFAAVAGLIEDRAINPGKVFDLTLPLDQAAEGYRAMDERRAIKALLRP